MPRKTRLRDLEYLRIRIEDVGITLFGEIKRRKDGQAIFTGIADGLTSENHHLLYRHNEISGHSNKNGRIWLRDLIFREMTISGDDSAPNPIKVLARTAYMGDFDPRASPIAAATVELPTSIWLSDRRIKEQRVDHSTKSMVITAPLKNEPIILFSDDRFSLEINHHGSFGEHVDYNEKIHVKFKAQGTSDEADLILDALCLLVSVLTQARCWPIERTYWALKGDRRDKAQRYAWIDKQVPTNFTDWLVLPGKIIATLQEMLPHWIPAVRQATSQTLIWQFVNAANKDGYAEDDFLALCQCFEGLSAHRIGQVSTIPGCDTKALVHINNSAKAIGLNKAVRGKIRKAFEDATRMTLEDRLRKVFDTPPFCIQEVMRHRPDIHKEIARRRNQLSHGSTEGTIKTQADFERLVTETAVIRTLCLAEILFLGGLTAEQTARMVGLDIKRKHTRVR